MTDCNSPEREQLNIVVASHHCAVFVLCRRYNIKVIYSYSNYHRASGHHVGEARCGHNFEGKSDRGIYKISNGPTIIRHTAKYQYHVSHVRFRESWRVISLRARSVFNEPLQKKMKVASALEAVGISG